MAKQKEGVYDNILSCAKREFLNKGFIDASLRNIATDANTTTGSIYTRFGDKEGLFRALVEPVAKDMKAYFFTIEETFSQKTPDEQSREMINYSKKGALDMVDFIYNHFEEVQLLLDASYGTCFYDFLEELVNIEVEYTYKFMKTTGCTSINEKIIPEELIHIVTRSFFDGMFEIVRHKMSKENAIKYVTILQKYHQKGYEVILSPQEE